MRGGLCLEVSGKVRFPFMGIRKRCRRCLSKGNLPIFYAFTAVIWLAALKALGYLLNLSLELVRTLGILRPFYNFHPHYFMGALFISLLTLVLLLISAFVILLVLMQRTSQSGGMGAALGGGAAESAFGAETNNILTKGTIYGIIAFFVVALVLFLIYQSRAADRLQTVDAATLIGSDTAESSAGTTTSVVESVIADLADAKVEDAVGSIDAVVESVEVEAPVVDVDASATEAPSSN